MLNWLDFYELLLDRPLQPEDYLFPSISVKGTIEPHRPITSDMAQKIISNAATSAGLPNVVCSQHTVSGGVVHNIGSCLHQLASAGLWLVYIGGVDGLMANMYVSITSHMG